MYACMYVCMYGTTICIGLGNSVVCMFVCMYVCMYVCMHVWNDDLHWSWEFSACIVGIECNRCVDLSRESSAV